MKVFWEIKQDLDTTADKLSASFETVKLPTVVYAAVVNAFKSNSTLLPASARRFQDWNVSLLERFQDERSEKPSNPIDPLYE